MKGDTYCRAPIYVKVSRDLGHGGRVFVYRRGSTSGLAVMQVWAGSGGGGQGELGNIAHFLYLIGDAQSMSK